MWQVRTGWHTPQETGDLTASAGNNPTFLPLASFWTTFPFVVGLFAFVSGLNGPSAPHGSARIWAEEVVPSDVGLQASQQVNSEQRIDIRSILPLPDTTGKLYEGDDTAGDLLVVAFLGTECPLARLYGPRLGKMAETYAGRGVRFIGIHSNGRESLEEIAHYQRETKISFPLLRDRQQRAADLFQAERTPEVFVLDQEGRVLYRGRVDDQYGIGYARSGPTRHDLQHALDQLLAGEPVSIAETPAVGCLIGRDLAPNESSPVTYANQISRIMQQHCVECHRPGEIGPFSLTSYEEVRSWAEALEEVIREQRMPPWHANPEHGTFANARFMTQEEKELVYRWVAEGAPQGDVEQLPPPAEFTTGWRLSRTPDLVVPMRDRPFVVPAEGTVEYQYFVVDPGFTEDRWIQGAEVIPGNRSVVHHVIVFFRAPEGREQKGLGWLTAYVPGQNSFELGQGQARFVPAGSQLIFQMHYTPTGTPQEDLSRIGLIFADAESVREEILTFVAINQQFEIPPYAENYAVQAARGDFPEGSRLLAIAPHMHVRGRSFRVELEQSRDRSAHQVLLDVPRYDFNWQHAYLLAEPLPLGKGDRLLCEATFDNSPRNRANPDPSASVRWGDQTWEEMMLAFFEIALPVDAKELGGEQAERRLTDAELESARRAADELFRRFDRDGDGVIRRDEVPDAFRTFGFSRIDLNGDRKITREEALEAAKRSIRRQEDGRGL
jgi:mono/diheme cytochrome c family protein/thiol-disulfide isomerase/thioredoxin